jgi:hypothetical protein
MLQRNLLYTAVSRARQLVVLVGSRRALAKAIRTPGNGHRYTALDDRLLRGSTRLEAAAERRAGAGRRLAADPTRRPAGPRPG